MPNEPENIWSAARPFMSETERAALDQWADNLGKPQQEIILTGFYTNLVPFLAEGVVIRSLGLPIAGSEGLWGCGGDTHKLGSIGLTETVADLVKNTLAGHGVARIHCFMQAEAAMLAEILPRYYGVGLDAEVNTLDALILENIESGRVVLTKNLDMTVTVHDNCLSRYFDGRPQETLRAIVDKTGCKRVEMAHNRFQALCCGWAATIPTLYAENAGNPFKTMAYLVFSLHRGLAEAEDTGADALVTGCPACYLFLNLIKTLTCSRLEVYHILEIVEMAAGGTPARKAENRSWEILAQATTLILNWMLFPKNRPHFFPRPPAADRPVPPCPQPDEDAIKTWRITKLYKSRLIQNPFSRFLLARLTTAGARLYHYWLARQKNRARR